MSSALNVQMEMNINSFLSRMETTGTLIFTESEVYQYNAADENNDEYEALKTEEFISDELYSICIMENYVDFAIVYSNNHVVGKMSNGTTSLFGENLYTDLSLMINRQRTSDGWSTGYNDDYTRIYYVKRVNDNAVLVTSFYTTELEEVFEHPGGMEYMTVQLLNNNYDVIYTSDESETGVQVEYDIYSRIEGQTAVTSIDNDYLVTVNNCGDSWYVVSYVPTQIILKEKNDVTYYIYIIGIISTIVAICIGFYMFDKTINPMKNIVSVLDSKAHKDLLTGVLNKRSFEESVEAAINSNQENLYRAVILLDVDNFKGVNDTLGHAYGDKVLAEIGNILRKVFSKDDYLGRLGGDEFCVYLNIPESRQGDYTKFIETKCAELCSAFNNNYTGDDNNYKISASIGASVFPLHGTSFSKLYQCADRALYSSKHRGKDTYTIFNK
jgi:diguanylate cyclase (GGDEF)-like protein